VFFDKVQTVLFISLIAFSKSNSISAQWFFITIAFYT